MAALDAAIHETGKISVSYWMAKSSPAMTIDAAAIFSHALVRDVLRAIA
jgi:hypothetical protein